MTKLATKFMANKEKGFYKSTNELMNELEKVVCQKDQNWEKGTTAYIFEDGSAVIVGCDIDAFVDTNYGLSVDHEQVR